MHLELLMAGLCVICESFDIREGNILQVVILSDFVQSFEHEETVSWPNGRV